MSNKNQYLELCVKSTYLGTHRMVTQRQPAPKRAIERAAEK